jgi:lysophospholipase L1-like esterase
MNRRQAAAALLGAVLVLVAEWLAGTFGPGRSAHPGASSACRPEPGYFPEDPTAWQRCHEALVHNSRHEPARVAFVGDSMTAFWDRAVWAERFAPLGAGLFGVPGDTTRQLLWRLEHGELDAARPRVVVLMIGVNNLIRSGDEPTDAADGIAAVVATLRSRLPEAKVAVLGVLPVAAAPRRLADRIAEVNRLCRRLDDGRRVRFVDTYPAFLDPADPAHPSATPVPKRTLFLPDNIHLSPEGYRTLADLVGPVVKELLSDG